MCPWGSFNSEELEFYSSSGSGSGAREHWDLYPDTDVCEKYKHKYVRNQ